MNGFVDAQTDFVKQIVKLNNDMFSYSTEQMMKHKAK